MNESLRQQIDQAMAEFEKQREVIVKARDEIASISVTARSKDRVVEVTLGADGKPTGLRFIGTKHQSMSGKELANTIMETMSRAHQELSSRVYSRFGELTPTTGAQVSTDGPDALDRLEGFGLEELLKPLKAPGGPLSPEWGERRA
ncbi:YbaB/EbfC family nucleoid-associated protein [Streptomyces sp. NPDC048290]|uniref:YbaB/EbfC family nucleoid-associated protein n=1 Tax=Streptomyces sp. NPDC048290 TaxID=3155811 RepID=UPI0034256700